MQSGDRFSANGKHMCRLIPLLTLLMYFGMFGCTALKVNLDYNRAIKAYREHRYDVAQEYLRSALRVTPGDEKSLSLLGWIRFKQGEVDEAGKFLTDADKLNPENISTIEGLGWVYYSKGRNEDAGEKFKKLLEYAEKHLQNENWIYYSSDDQKYIQSVYSDGNYGLGLIAKRSGAWASARKYFENALSQPNQFIDHETIALELTDVLFELEEYRLAAAQYKVLLSKTPEMPSFLNRYAWCLYKTGNLGGAKKLYIRWKDLYSSVAKFYSMFPGGQGVTQKLFAKRIAETYYGLALIYLKEQRFDDARRELAFALRISPYFHHPLEIAALFEQHPDWGEVLGLQPLDKLP